MMNDVVLMFSATDEKTPYEQGENRTVITVQSIAARSRGTQRQFSENFCSEDDLKSRIFGTFFCKIYCLPAYPRIFEHLKK